jgi:hypothetical protein
VRDGHVDYGPQPIDFVAHPLANGPEVKQPLLSTSHMGYLAGVSVEQPPPSWGQQKMLLQRWSKTVCRILSGRSGPQTDREGHTRVCQPGSSSLSIDFKKGFCCEHCVRNARVVSSNPIPGTNQIRTHA